MNDESAEVRRIGTAVFNAMVTGDTDRLRELIAPEMRFHYPLSFAQLEAERDGRPAPAGHDPVREGGDSFIAMIEQAHTTGPLKDVRPEIIHVVADGDVVVTLARIHAVVHGTPYDNLYAYHMRVAAGRVVEQWDLLDSAYAQRAFSGIHWTERGPA
jgi:ketosteroid isomerase-like protein